MRHALILTAAAAIAAAPALAGQTAYWDGTGCTLHPVDGRDHVAELHCHNALNAGLGESDLAYMEADGIGVSLTVDNTSEPVIGQHPDEFIFVPDPGYRVEPQTLLIDEMADGVAYVYEWVGS